jgi:transglutaminase-like putative cysteine protease
MIYKLYHTTTYHYADPVSLCHNVVHLQPRPCPRQVCHRTQLSIHPEPGPMYSHQDYFGNPVAVFTIQKPHKELRITAQHEIDVASREPIILEETPPWEKVRDQLAADRAPEWLDAYQYTFDSRFIRRGPDLAEFALPSFPQRRSILQGMLDLNRRIYRDFRYDPKATTVTTPIRDVLRLKRGVCQDFAHLFIGCIRSLGLACRYVSGYLLTRQTPEDPRLVGADASHAWVSIYCPDLGWVDFDPTNNLMPGDRHITIAWGRDYDDVSPIKGVILGGGSHTMSVGVEVTPA